MLTIETFRIAVLVICSQVLLVALCGALAYVLMITFQVKSSPEGKLDDIENASEEDEC